MKITIKKVLFCLISMLLIMLVGSVTVFASPHNGDRFDFRQPDGSTVPVRVFGDEYYQRVESLDGYSLVRDSKGYICYAGLDANGSFTSTGEVYKGKDISINDAASLGLKKGLSEHQSVVLDQIKEKRKELAPETESRILAASPSTTPTPLPSGVPVIATATPAKIVGLVVLINFPDLKGAVSTADIENAFNKVGSGSVYDHFYNISGEKIQFTNRIIGYYTAKNKKSYYDSGNGYQGSSELLKETLSWLNTTNPSFDGITLNYDKSIKALTFLYAGTPDAGWANGLWPHSGGYNYTLSNGIRINSHQFTNIGTRPEIATINHECEHMILGWPDFYDYDGDSAVIGNFNNFINPYCRCALNKFYTIKWLNGLPNGTVVTVPAGTREVYGYINTKNNNEMFLIENIRKRGDWLRFPGEGLVIWHIDKRGNNDYQDMTAARHYITSIEQADGRFDMEKNVNEGDSRDFFRAGYKDRFDDTTLPNSKWWNGSSSGFNISNISAIGDNMTFVINNTNVSPTPTPTPVPPKKDPVTLYKFDEASGIIASDSSGSGTSATLTEAAWTAGKSGNAVELSGANQYVILPSGIVSGLNDITVSAWVKPDTVSNWVRVFDFGESTNSYMFMTAKSSSNTFRFAITAEGSANEQIIEGGPPLSAGAWCHVAVTLKENEGILYLNGKEVGRNASMTLKPSDLGFTSCNYIGKSQWNDPYLDGLVDDFRIYNRALAASEIMELAEPKPENISISGYVKADVRSKSTSINAGFKVELTGTDFSAITDENGYFNIKDIPVIEGSYSIKITKTGYLTRTVPDIPGNKNSQAGSSDMPVSMWYGDFPKNGVQDNAINMYDVVQLASSFNSSVGDGRYDPLYDANNDSGINLSDVVILATHFSKGSSHYPPVTVTLP